MPRQIIVEHPHTWVSVALDEADFEALFDDPEAHPQNHDHQDITTNPFTGGREEYEHAGRVGDDRVSLKADRYLPLAWKDERGRLTWIGTPLLDAEKRALSEAEIDKLIAERMRLIRRTGRG
jgi:hypothetical protein